MALDQEKNKPKKSIKKLQLHHTIMTELNI